MLGLMLRHAEHGRVLGDVLDERREGRVAEQSLDQAAVAIVLLQELGVLLAERVALLRFERDLTLELGDVLCEHVSIRVHDMWW